MRAKQNHGVVYRGRVGALMRPKKIRRVPRRKYFEMVYCHSGPYAGRTLSLDAAADKVTLVFRVGDHVGCYRGGAWCPL